MREVARKPLGWSARRKPFGDSFVSCLLTCIIVIGGAVWAYFHFFENRHLDNWKDGHNFAKKQPTSEGLNHYRKRMISDIFGRHGAVETRLSKLYKDVKADVAYDEFNQTAEEIERELRDVMNELKARSVPKKYQEAHLWEAEAIHHHWNMLNALRENMAAAPEEKNIKESTMERAKTSYKKGKGLRLRARNRYGTF